MFSGKYFKALIIFFVVRKYLTLNTIDDDCIEDLIKFRKLREAGFDNYDLTSIQEITDKNKNSLDAESIHRRRRSIEETNQWHVEFTAFGELYEMTMVHTEPILHPLAIIRTVNSDLTTEWKGDHPNCFLTGELLSHNGSVSAAFCNELTGIVTTDNHEIHFEVLPHDIRQRSVMQMYGHNTLVARKKRDNSKITGINPTNDNLETEDPGMNRKSRTKRAVPSTTFTMELAVYVDEDYLKNHLLVQSTSDRISAMLMKYNGVAFEWGRSDVLGYNVTLSIKHLEFFDTNPSWYNISSKLGVILGSICIGTENGLPYDHVHVHTGVENPDPGGVAYQTKVCDPRYRCGVSADGVSGYITTAHEIGHNMGMIHDSDAGCSDPDVGLMGGAGVGWSSCSVHSMDTMLQTGNHGCLWVDNILDNQINPVEIQGVNLEPGIPGQLKTNDEICEEMFGSGFAYREYPQIIPTTCNTYSCINLNIGNSYGQMFRVSSSISGSYCEDNKICFKGSCQPWSAAQLTNPEVRAGGWSDWGSWTSCSRTCGTGISFRKRKCNNPTPKNHAPCDGDEHDALACNTTPCLSDSPDDSVLKIQRATESCAYLIDNNILNGTLYKPEGQIYSSFTHGNCEVACATVAGYTEPSFTRHGLIEHGTPCPGTLDTADQNNHPRRPGFYWACLEGYCKKFDCANTLNSAVNDGCGVCGGDNSTCNVESGNYTDNLAQWGRGEWFTLPVGAYNIELFSEGNNGYYVEIYSKENKRIITPSAYSGDPARIFTTGDNPISYGGTLWHYTFNTQIMYAAGPLDTPVVVKVFNFNTNPNQGVHYLYSTPLDIGSCSGTCQNGGAWDQSICACNCVSGFSGTLCDSQCPSSTPICPHGSTLNLTTCECDCNDKQYGRTCDCMYPYTGSGCVACKYYSCQNGGNFSAATCRCICPPGYGGLQCETACVNVQDSTLCATQASTGNCSSDNVNMEQNCMVACNLCVESSCLSSQFTCASDVSCIDLAKFCDGTADCSDSSDELNCFGSTGRMVNSNVLFMTLSLGVSLIWY